MRVNLPRQFTKPTTYTPLSAPKPTQQEPTKPAHLDVNEAADDVKDAVWLARLFILNRQITMSELMSLVGYKANTQSNTRLLRGYRKAAHHSRLLGSKTASRVLNALLHLLTPAERMAFLTWQVSGRPLTQNYNEQTFDIPNIPQRHLVWLDGYVYLFSDALGNYKIGRSNNPDRRLNELRVNKTIIPYDFHEVHRFKCESMVDAERLLHERFADKRHKGEWFALSDEDVAWVCSIDCYTQEFGFEEVNS